MRSLIVVVAVAASAASLPAQSVTSIEPGMTREQVVAKLGEPVSARSRNSFTYLLYRNGCEKKCGMNDLVVLDSGKVIDAVFRSTNRKYTGTSSSPRMVTEVEAKKNPNAGAPLKTGTTPTTPPAPSTPSPVPLR